MQAVDKLFQLEEPYIFSLAKLRYCLDCGAAGTWVLGLEFLGTGDGIGIGLGNKRGTGGYGTGQSLPYGIFMMKM